MIEHTGHTDAHYHFTFWRKSESITAELPRNSVGVATGYHRGNPRSFHVKCHGSRRFHVECHGSGHVMCRGSVRGKLHCTDNCNPRTSAETSTADQRNGRGVPQIFTPRCSPLSRVALYTSPTKTRSAYFFFAA